MYIGASPTSPNRPIFASISTSFSRRPIQIIRAPYLRIRYSLNASPIPPAPPITTYTPPTRYPLLLHSSPPSLFLPSPSPLPSSLPSLPSSFPPPTLHPSSHSNNSRRYHSPRLYTHPSPCPSHGNPRTSSTGHLPSSSTSTSLTRQCGYSFAIDPTNPSTLPCPGFSTS